MNKYLRNEAIGGAVIFLLVALWRCLIRNSTYAPFYRVELAQLGLLALGLLCIAIFYSRTYAQIYPLYIGIGLLGIAVGIGVGNIIRVNVVSFTELSSYWEYLGIAAVSLVVLIVWIYRIGKMPTSLKQT